MPRDHVTLLDAAMGTQLAQRGVRLDGPLWSARANIDHPDEVEAVHVEALRAGAMIITANTFRTAPHHARLAGRTGEDAERLTGMAVSIARKARDRISPTAKVYGSIAPLEDCYHPERTPSDAHCREAHAEHMDLLCSAGVDGLLIETMPTAREAIIAAELAEDRMPGRWILSVCPRDEGPAGMLLNGDDVHLLLRVAQRAEAVGFNCGDPYRMMANLHHLREVLPDGPPLLAAANTARRSADLRWTATPAVDPEVYAELAVAWRDGGADVIGGCCGTTAAHLHAIARRLRL